MVSVTGIILFWTSKMTKEASNEDAASVQTTERDSQQTQN